MPNGKKKPVTASNYATHTHTLTCLFTQQRQQQQRQTTVSQKGNPSIFIEETRRNTRTSPPKHSANFPALKMMPASKDGLGKKRELLSYVSVSGGPAYLIPNNLTYPVLSPSLLVLHVRSGSALPCFALLTLPCLVVCLLCVCISRCHMFAQKSCTHI